MTWSIHACSGHELEKLYRCSANPQSTIYNLNPMDPARIEDLLAPFLSSRSLRRAAGPEESGVAARAPLSSLQLESISTYIDLLLRWNSRISLTAVREPEEILTRHFGESLFAASHLFPLTGQRRTANRVIDVGSGAGFPGLPIKIWAPDLHLTLIESNQKKASFLREVVRTLTLTNIDIFSARAEDFPSTAGVVILRAVERFEQILPIAARLVAPGGRLALLIGNSQVARAEDVAERFLWDFPIPTPRATNTVLLIGKA
jgi:16S rRNA (guanine527-N7)-methyltransferase